MGGGPGRAAPPMRPRTNRCPQLGRLPQPPAASQQVIASLRWTAGLLREGEQPISWAPLLLTSSPILRPGPPGRGRTRRCAGRDPRPAQTSRAPARSAILHQHQGAPAPPGPPLCPASAR